MRSKVLANQQKDGDSPIQNIVTGLREKKVGTYYERFEKHHCLGQTLCRGGGPLAEGQRPFRVKKTEVLRKGADDLTPRAEEVNTQTACINVDHLGEKFWRPPLVDGDWHAFCQAIYGRIEVSK